jgi:LysM repeat protein
VRRDDWRRYAAPAAFLLAVTLAVLLIRSGLESGTTTARDAQPTTTSKQVATTTTTTTKTKTRTTRTTRTTTTTVSGKRYWTVRPGDTFSVISSQSGVSVAELARLNPKVSSTSLFIGEKIRIR